MGRAAALVRSGLLAVAVLVGWAGGAAAHTRSETHSAWQIDGQTIHLQFTIPEVEAKRLARNGLEPNDAALAAYVAAHVGATAQGKPCPPTAPVRPIASEPGYHRFEATLACPSAKAIRVHSTAFFDIVATHTDFAQIQDANGRFFEELITKDQPELDVSNATGGGALQNAGFFDYVRMGVMHILTGVDHMSFLLGLVLIARRLRDLTFVITGFTLGHSLTLALAVTGVLRPHAEYIDALVALTIALIGAENIAASSGRTLTVALATFGLLAAMAVGRLMGLGGLPPLLLLGAGLFTSNYLMLSGHLRDAARLRLLVTLVFGLIHGFGFAADLLEQRIPTGKLAELLVGFNIGVEIGQLSLVLGVLALVYVLVKLKLALPRPIVTDVAASGLVGLGLYWLVSRSYA